MWSEYENFNTLSAESGDQLSIADRHHQKRSIRPELPKRSDSRPGVPVLHSTSRSAPTGPPRSRPTRDQVTWPPATGPPPTSPLVPDTCSPHATPPGAGASTRPRVANAGTRGQGGSPNWVHACAQSAEPAWQRPPHHENTGPSCSTQTNRSSHEHILFPHCHIPFTRSTVYRGRPPP